MARNKKPQAASEKREEIVAAARRLFITNGYASTSMNRLAKEAGVAANTIYWYFGDKDDVLVAVVSAVFRDALSDYQAVVGEPIASRILWVVRRLSDLNELVTTVHARVPHSTSVAEWHTDFHLHTGSLFKSELEALSVPSETVDSEVSIAVFTIEGILTHIRDEQEQWAICQTLASRWPSPRN